MSRQPTPRAVAYAWHTAALDDRQPWPTTHDLPQCGWFKCKLVSGGPYVPARIFLDQHVDPDTGDLLADEVMRCEVNGESRDPELQWRWLFGSPLSEAEFNYMVALRQHAAWHRPDSPEANPRRKIDNLTSPILF